MLLRVLCASVAAFSALPRVAGAQVEMQLAPADEAGAGPYRVAVLSLVNRSGHTVRAVTVRMAEGGPAFLCPLVVPPEANGVKIISLPVSVPEQAYVLRALAEENASAAPLAAATVTTTWRADRVSLVEFIDPEVYARHEDKAASWPKPFVQGLFVASALACAGMSAAVFLRRAPWRLAAVAAIAIASAGAIALWVRRDGPVAQTRLEPLASRAPNRLAGAILIVSSPRTTPWRHPSARLVPLYRSTAAMAQEDAVIDPASGISLTLHGGEVRIFFLPENQEY